MGTAFAIPFCCNGQTRQALAIKVRAGQRQTAADASIHRQNHLPKPPDGCFHRPLPLFAPEGEVLILPYCFLYMTLFYHQSEALSSISWT